MQKSNRDLVDTAVWSWRDLGLIFQLCLPLKWEAHLTDSDRILQINEVLISGRPGSVLGLSPGLAKSCRPLYKRMGSRRLEAHFPNKDIHVDISLLRCIEWFDVSLWWGIVVSQTLRLLPHIGLGYEMMHSLSYWIATVWEPLKLLRPVADK